MSKKKDVEAWRYLEQHICATLGPDWLPHPGWDRSNNAAAITHTGTGKSIVIKLARTFPVAYYAYKYQDTAPFCPGTVRLDCPPKDIPALIKINLDKILT